MDNDELYSNITIISAPNSKLNSYSDYDLFLKWTGKGDENEFEEENENKITNVNELREYSDISKDLDYNDNELSDSTLNFLKQNSDCGYKYKNIGEGSFSKVKKIYRKNNKDVSYVIKTNKANNRDYLAGEKAYADKNINNNNLAKTLFCSKNCKNVITEYCNGKVDLHGLLNAEQKNIRQYFDRYKLITDVLNGLCELEKNSLIHNDIKPQNIVFNKDENGIKNFVICDFGLTQEVNNDFEYLRSCGTFAYISPEKVYSAKFNDKSMKSTFASDIWSAGITFFEALSCYINVGYFSSEVFNMILKQDDKKDIQNYIDSSIDDYVELKYKELKPLLKSMLKINPSERAKASECLEMVKAIQKENDKNSLGREY